ncbi:MAG TPA: hypothetical protein VMV18_07540 [bacterium]|nr:hypothetical protein [bacterium]
MTDEQPAQPERVHNVVLGETTPDAVLAAISLARRIPGGAPVMFAPRDGIKAALTTPAHLQRPRPYRLHVVGHDLARETREETIAALENDPRHSLHWYDANVWTPEDRAVVETLTSHGSWFNVPKTHHPFPAIDAAAAPLALEPDPFTETLLAMAEARLAPADEEAWGLAWRDTLEVLADHPLSVPATVKPLLHGMPAELAPLDRAEGEALRAEIDHLFGGASLVKVPAGSLGTAVLLVLPSSRHQPAVPMAQAAMKRTGCEVALVLYDRSHHAVLVGARHGAEPPVDLRPAFEKLLLLPFVRRDRLLRGFAQVALVETPKDGLERLVAGLL